MCNFRLLAVIVLIVVLGCSEPEIIIPPLEIPTSGQNVMIEELTGVRCPNCPSAAARIESIKLLYGDNIVVVNIHGDLLTKPLPESKYDFRSMDALFLEESFKPLIGKPSVVINRKIHPQFELLSNPLQDQWQSIVESELQLEEMVTIVATIDKLGENYTANIGVVPLVSLEGQHYVHVYLLENNLIDAQEDIDRIIHDYQHDHVLRDIVTPLEGLLIDNLNNENEVINKSIDFTLENKSWVEENMEMVYFLTNDNGQVLQVNKLSFEF